MPQLFSFNFCEYLDFSDLETDNEKLLLKQDETDYIERIDERLNDVYNEERYCKVKGNMLVSYLPVQRFV